MLSEIFDWFYPGETAITYRLGHLSEWIIQAGADWNLCSSLSYFGISRLQTKSYLFQVPPYSKYQGRKVVEIDPK